MNNSVLTENFIDSPEYAKFIMPTADELKEELRWSKLSRVEKQLELLRNDYYNGKIDVDRYIDAIDCELFYAVESNEITDEKRNELFDKFKPAEVN